jgi:hypothetical protein
LRKLDFSLDKNVAALVALIGLLLIGWSIYASHYGIILPVILLIAPIIYLALRTSLCQNALSEWQISKSRGRLLSQVVFISSFLISVWLLYGNHYDRPPLYFLMVIIGSASIVFDIVTLDETNSRNTVSILIKMMILAVTVYGGLYFEFSGFHGVDPWWHGTAIQELTDQGNLTMTQLSTSIYYLFPIFHILSSVTQIVTGLSVQDSIFVTVGTVLPLICLFVYLTGKKLFNTKIGLFSMLMVLFSAYTIQMASALIPMSLGFCFFLTIAYLIFYRGDSRLTDSLLIMVVAIVLILTHTIAGLITLITLLAIWIGFLVYRRINGENLDYRPISFNLMLFFLAFLVTRWTQKPLEGEPFLQWSLSNLSQSLDAGVQPVLTTSANVSSIPYATSILDQGGYLLLLALGILGALISLHPHYRSGPRLAIVAAAAILIIIPYSSQFLSLQNILPERWYLFSYVPLSILAMLGLTNIAGMVVGGSWKLLLLILIILPIVFMSITNSIADDDSPMVYNGGIRLGYSQSEITAIKTLSDIQAGVPVTDLYYGTIFPSVLGNDTYDLMLNLPNDIFIQRDYYLNNSAWNERFNQKIYKGNVGNFSGGSVQISQYIHENGIDQYPVIYSNGGVRVYFMAGIK